jgi:maleate isomerase
MKISSRKEQTMSSEAFHVALIVPASNTVMESDLHQHTDSTCVITTWRLFLKSVTRDAETEMLRDELPRSLQLIRTTAPRAVVFGCTSAGSLGGLARDKEIARAIEKQSKAPAITVLGAVVTQLRILKPVTVAVFTPYQEELTRSVTQCVSEAGYKVPMSMGMGFVDNQEIGRVTPEEIVSFVESNMKGVETDCIFLSCTNWRAIGAIEPLKLRLRVPVISSNQAAIESVRAVVHEH